MSKYKASKCEYNGIKFDSKKERDRYIFLKGMEENGKIRITESLCTDTGAEREKYYKFKRQRGTRQSKGARL